MAGRDGNGGDGLSSGRRRATRLCVALIVALAVLVPLVGASGARAADAPRNFFGVVPWEKFQGTDYARLGQAKVRNARTPFLWKKIEPAKGEFNWKGTDHFVGTLALSHVRTLPFLNGSAPWVNKNERRPPLDTKKDRKRWKKFVKTCVRRYGRDGTFWQIHPEIPKVPITVWQVWNEQNSGDYMEPRPKPKKYAKLLKLTHRAAKSEDKRARFVLGGMFGNPVPKHSINAKKFLAKLYKQRHVKRYFNAVAVHPYAPDMRNLKLQMTRLHKVVKSHHDRAKMWITEMGWGSAKPKKKWPLLKGPEGQKRMLKKSFRLLLNKRKRWGLKRVYWFLWRDAAPEAPTNCSFCKSAGLFTYDYKAKPAWKTFLSFTRS